MTDDPQFRMWAAFEIGRRGALYLLPHTIRDTKRGVKLAFLAHHDATRWHRQDLLDRGEVILCRVWIRPEL